MLFFGKMIIKLTEGKPTDRQKVTHNQQLATSNNGQSESGIGF
jgi:hypothetical protein